MAWLVDFVKEKEGFREKAYQDSVGVWTVGYGTTRLNGKKVTSSDSLSHKQAQQKLEEELQDFLDHVVAFNEKHNRDWNNKQVAALTSFIYNLGKRALKQVTDDGKRDDATIAAKMKLYYNAGGKKLPGLVKRREEESAHFLS